MRPQNITASNFARTLHSNGFYGWEAYSATLMEEVNEIDVNLGRLASDSRTLPAVHQHHQHHHMLLAENPASHTYRPPLASTIQHRWQPHPSLFRDSEHPH